MWLGLVYLLITACGLGICVAVGGTRHPRPFAIAITVVAAFAVAIYVGVEQRYLFDRYRESEMLFTFLCAFIVAGMFNAMAMMIGLGIERRWRPTPAGGAAARRP